MKCGRASGRFSLSLAMFSAKAVHEPAATPMNDSRRAKSARAAGRGAARPPAIESRLRRRLHAAAGIAVGQHHALGRPGRARRVDDGGHVLALDAVHPLRQLGLQGVGPLPAQAPQRLPGERPRRRLPAPVALHDHDVLQPRHGLSTSRTLASWLGSSTIRVFTPASLTMYSMRSGGYVG